DAIYVLGGADITLNVVMENNYGITTGDGDDVGDMRLDNVDGEDAINLAGGRDRLIIAGDDSIGYSIPPSAQENDDAWQYKAGIEELEIVASNLLLPPASRQTIVLDEQAQAAGLEAIYFTAETDGDDQATN